MVVTTEQGASILVFPKVIADGSRDTIIQITNTSNDMWNLHCFYVNGAPTIPGDPPTYLPGSANLPLCMETDFDIYLTREQPTHWVVSTGRLYNPSDEDCSQGPPPVTCCSLSAASCPGNSGVSGSDAADCCDAGYDPGHVPPVAPDFTGELMCMVVDSGGMPVPRANIIKGEATLEDVVTGDVSKYNAIGIQGYEIAPAQVDDGVVICLGSNGAPDPTLCPNGYSYPACPQEWRLDHPATGAPDPVYDQLSSCPSPPCSSVSTNLTVVPCTQNFETQALTVVGMQFLVTNEFEQQFTTSTSFACWGSFDLGAPTGSLLPGISSWFTAGALGSSTLHTRIRSTSDTPGGMLAVIEETHQIIASGYTARSAQNGHMIMGQTNVDLVTIPLGQVAIPPE
jgi:hypothetical protein